MKVIKTPKDIKKIFCSFSGGKTSAYMAKWIKENFAEGFELKFVFANTGQEHEKTLEFVNNCDKAWGLNVVWVEANVNQERGKGTDFNIVTFETATRSGDLFEEMIKKFGIPNKSYPHCNRELKLQPMTKYMRSIGWQNGEYLTAIGIRADEGDRMDADFENKCLWYPLIKLGIKKRHIQDYWKEQAFTLEVPEHLGNCTWCWKKSIRKHLTLAKNHPEVFEVPARLEALYAKAGANEGGEHERQFFRKHMTTKDIFNLAQMPFVEFKESIASLQLDLDLSNGCSESCDIFSETGGAA